MNVVVKEGRGEMAADGDIGEEICWPGVARAMHRRPKFNDTWTLLLTNQLNN